MMENNKINQEFGMLINEVIENENLELIDVSLPVYSDEWGWEASLTVQDIANQLFSVGILHDIDETDGEEINIYIWEILSDVPMFLLDDMTFESFEELLEFIGKYWEGDLNGELI